jgi:hypothetical protein
MCRILAIGPSKKDRHGSVSQRSIASLSCSWLETTGRAVSEPVEKLDYSPPYMCRIEFPSLAIPCQMLSTTLRNVNLGETSLARIIPGGLIHASNTAAAEKACWSGLSPHWPVAIAS